MLKINPVKAFRKHLYKSGMTPQKVDKLWNDIGIRRISMDGNKFVVQSNVEFSNDSIIKWIPAN